MEGYSRTILAGMASLYQDEIAILQLLHAALAQYGRPEAIVSDNGRGFQGRCLQRPVEKTGYQSLVTSRNGNRGKI